jgi:hypothetical protein
VRLTGNPPTRREKVSEDTTPEDNAPDTVSDADIERQMILDDNGVDNFDDLDDEDGLMELFFF